MPVEILSLFCVSINLKLTIRNINFNRDRRFSPPLSAPAGGFRRDMPIEAPLVAPEKRPSVIKATSPRQSHTGNQRCRRQHLPHSGSTLRSFVADDDYVTGLILPFIIASVASSSESNTRAGPSCTIISGATAERLTTAPSGATLPNKRQPALRR